MDAKAIELGFDSCRIVGPDAIPDAPERLARWLAEGHQGDMGWMAETAARRSDPRVLWPAVRSIVMLGTNYGPAVDPLATLSRRNKGAISVYARHRDYHDVIKGKLKHLATWLARASDEEAAVKVFVDTAPVMEKPLAAAAGVGWQGKHTNLVSRDFGSWLFLGSIFTTLDLAVDTAMADHCGSCRACLDICPTKAFPAPYRLDARRCISYLTIEHQGHIDRRFRPAIGNRIYGCDDCLAVCPWNKFAEVSREAKLTARADLAEPSLADLVDLDDAAFRVFFSGSPIKRIGHARFLRNVLIAIGNSGDRSLAPHAVARLRHPSPLVRAMAVWALHCLIGGAALRQEAGETVRQDPDIDVRVEWEAA
ncbi:tRNA epoxyqueuosine(34) reductase QueG [Lichenihabitans psoromatis]|uniref:tRNA epoxyqueuosine(34) reductase QueG n=1 Tax=Lichenihabitans psoromatis TaxID=2528642 RepID=UPI00315D1708